MIFFFPFKSSENRTCRRPPTKKKLSRTQQQLLITHLLVLVLDLLLFVGDRVTTELSATISVGEDLTLVVLTAGMVVLAAETVSCWPEVCWDLAKIKFATDLMAARLELGASADCPPRKPYASKSCCWVKFIKNAFNLVVVDVGRSPTLLTL